MTDNRKKYGEHPLASVVIVTYKRPGYLRKTLDSVQSQTYPNIEVIVIDNGQCDETKRLVESQRGNVRYIRSEINHLSAARNRGLAEAKGKYIAFLDDDDTWMENKIEEQVNVLEKSPDNIFTFCGAQYLDEHDEVKKEVMIWHGREMTFDSLFEGNFIISPSLVLMRRSVVVDAGGFDEEMIQSADYELMMRLAKRGPYHFDPRVMANYRLHGMNLSSNLKRRLKTHKKVFNKPEIIEGKSRLQRRIRIARSHYDIALVYYQKKEYKDAAEIFLKALVYYPLVGLYDWPDGIRNVRFSFPYRIVRAYYLTFKCFVKSILLQSRDVSQVNLK